AGQLFSRLRKRASGTSRRDLGDRSTFTGPKPLRSRLRVNGRNGFPESGGVRLSMLQESTHPVELSLTGNKSSVNLGGFRRSGEADVDAGRFARHPSAPTVSSA